MINFLVIRCDGSMSCDSRAGPGPGDEGGSSELAKINDFNLCSSGWLESVTLTHNGSVGFDGDVMVLVVVHFIIVGSCFVFLAARIEQEVILITIYALYLRIVVRWKRWPTFHANGSTHGPAWPIILCYWFYSCFVPMQKCKCACLRVRRTDDVCDRPLAVRLLAIDPPPVELSSRNFLLAAIWVWLIWHMIYLSVNASVHVKIPSYRFSWFSRKHKADRM